MNKISIIVESILAAGIVALFILFFTVTPGSKKTVNQDVEAAGELLPIAVINTDSILKNYTLAVEASDKLMSRYEESTVKLDTKAKSLSAIQISFPPSPPGASLAKYKVSPVVFNAGWPTVMELSAKIFTSCGSPHSPLARSLRHILAPKSLPLIGFE